MDGYLVKMRMNILCLMGLFPEKYEEEILKNSLSGVQYAANKLQWAIVEGLSKQSEVKIDIVNSLYIGSYPHKYKKARIPSFSFDIHGKVRGENVGFLNLPFIKLISKYYGLKSKIEQWIRKNPDGEKVVIAYAMTSPFVELLHYVKNNHPEVKCILVVPDLPEYMDVTNKSVLYSLFKKIHISHIRKNVVGIDGYVFLTEYMKEWFGSDVNYTVIEGIYIESMCLPQETIIKEKVILYAGGLCEEYGILELVHAFIKTRENDWKLELIGDGPLLPKLKQMAKEEDCLSVIGVLPNRDVLKRQKQASLLVNPRKAGQTFTKYSFPSKTIEYMSSGTPMAGYRLPGIPDEYYNYIYEIPQDDNGLEVCLKKIMMLSNQERNKIGLSAKHFIQTEKNAATQCAKIVKLIDGIVVSCTNQESRGSK